MKHILNIEHFINEGKLDDLTLLYSDKITDHESNWLKSMSNNSAAYYKWLLKTYLKDKVDYRDNISGVNILLDVLDDYFKKYLRIKSNLPKKDINQIEDSYELIKLVDEYNDFHLINEDKDVKLIIHDNRWIVFIPKTYNAAKKWGWGRFCTSHDEGYYKLHNVNNEALIYVYNKFDHKKHCIIQQVNSINYTIWDYEDDNFYTARDGVRGYLEDFISDGYLNIPEIIKNLPRLDNNDFYNSYINLIFELYKNSEINMDGISSILEEDIDVYDEDVIRRIAKQLSLNDLRNNLHGYV